MHVRQIAGKFVQISNLPSRCWWQFIRGWMQRNHSATVPCGLPLAKKVIYLPQENFYESYSFFSESRQGVAELSFFLNHAQPGDVIFDIGSFRGVYGVAAKAAFGDSVQVHAFEPLAKNNKAISTIAELNGLTGFTLVPCAVGAEGTITGVVNEQDSMLREGDLASSAQPVHIPSTSIDVYGEKTGLFPTLMKIDVDGFEIQVLKGAQKCLTSHKPRIWLELHPTFLKAQQRSWQEVIELLKTAGYRTIEFYDDYHLPEHEIGFHIWCAA